MARRNRMWVGGEASPDEHQLIHWYAEHRGIPVARLLREAGVDELVERAAREAQVLGVPVPCSILHQLQESQAA